MSLHMNIFRILGDVSHTLSKCILIWAIHSNSSAEGVSLITQVFYCMVFLSRYLDYFSAWHLSAWNNTLKTFYILSSVYIIAIMLRVYARTREREKAWKLGGACLAGSAILAPMLMLIFRSKSDEFQGWSFTEVSWIFSIVLESVCVLPQLLLLRQTTVPTVIDSFYLLTLGSYRGFYILNWFLRELDTNSRKPDALSVIFGIIQTAFYVDFAWVYYSRQRVKLRHGGLVDSDDLRSGWLLRRVLGHKSVSGGLDEGDEESSPALGSGNRSATGRTASKWGSRGISVSADNGVLEDEDARQDDFTEQEEGIITGRTEGDEDAKMQDPDELAKILEGEGSDDDGVLPSSTSGGVNGVKNGSEWHD
ncbi:ER lumen protein retaining receptor-domain-containing protein [Calycina marina]|uniref:ER lumen protein retaining receptor-domain-containing protein n=1 Tax=Calycina marina TaxID=1763456 RepID=A0A9P8CI02_9HELO|nr:ER lumen protein retaining receptor-domain-containing protein [Calycina marina]